MRPGDSAWAEPVGTFAIIALAFALAFGWALVKTLRDEWRARRAVRELRAGMRRDFLAAQRDVGAALLPPLVDVAARLREWTYSCPMHCTDPTCPYRVVGTVGRREA